MRHVVKFDDRLPRFIEDMLAAPPQRGQGLNLWFYKTARVLHGFHTPDEIIAMLEAATAGQSLQRNEIERAVERSRDNAWMPGEPTTTTRFTLKWPPVDQEARQRIITTGGDISTLTASSPSKVTATDDILDIVFPGNPLICAGYMQSFRTLTRATWRGKLSSKPLIVPNPMSARTGRTQEGKVSEHTLENTGERRFLIIEQDSGTPDDQAAILMHLAQLAPLALVVHSGNKSIHGWVFVAGIPDDTLKTFMSHAVGIGADRALWTKSQFTRIPGGTHKNGAEQKVLFFNPVKCGRNV